MRKIVFNIAIGARISPSFDRNICVKEATAWYPLLTIRSYLIFFLHNIYNHLIFMKVEESENHQANGFEVF